MKRVSRLLAGLLCLALVISALPLQAFAAGERIEYDMSVPATASVADPEYDEHHIYVERNSKGEFDPVLVTFTVRFLDSVSSFDLRFMQNEILYDSGFFYTTRKAGSGSKIDVSFVQYLGRPMVKLSTMSYTMQSGAEAVASFYLTPRSNLADGTTTTISPSAVLCYDGSGARYVISTKALTITIGSRPLPTSTVTYFTSGGTMDPTAFPEIDAEYTYYDYEQPYYAQTVVTGAEIALPGAPTRENYAFLGWYDGAELHAAGERVTVSADVSYVASWAAYPTVTLNPNGGSYDGERTMTAAPNSTVTLGTPTKSRSTFLGWSDGSDTYNGLYTVGTGSVTLTAQWKAWPALTFDPNGGTVTNATVTATPFTTVSLPYPTREGYTFLGWEGVTGMTVYVGENDMTLKALWAKNYTLTLDPDGGAVAGALDFEAPAGVSITLPQATKEQNTFGGWSDGTGTYATYVMGSADVTLTAQWVQYPTLLLDANEGTVSKSAFTVAPGSAVTLPVPEREGYTFMGWKLGGAAYTDSYTIGSDSVTLKAEWKAYPTLRLDPANGTLNGAEGAYTAAPGTRITLPTPTRIGYNFSGWSDGNNTVSGSYTLNDNVTLTAQWTQCAHANAVFAVQSSGEWSQVEGEHRHVRTNYLSALCPDCGETLTKTEEELEACKASEDWSITATEHYHVCTVCGAKENAAEHSYSGGVCKECGFRNPNYIVIPTSTTEEKDDGIDVLVPDGVSYETTRLIDGSVLIELSEDVEAKVAVRDVNYGQVAALIDVSSGKIVKYLKKSYVEDEAVYCLINGTARIIVADNAGYFDDVSYFDWFKESVDFASSHELFQGYVGLFTPNSPMTRAMLVTVLHRLEDAPDTDAANAFSDVAAGTWYTDAVRWANENGIVTGYGNGVFGTNDNVTREQMAAILYRYAQKRGITGKTAALDAFPDAGEVSAWAKEAVEWCVGTGIIGGSDGRILPKGNATRAQVAAMIMRLVKAMVK